MGKEVKTNAMRILERSKIPYKLNRYECKEFIDGVHIADMLGQRYDMSFKTIVTMEKISGIRMNTGFLLSIRWLSHKTAVCWSLKIEMRFIPMKNCSNLPVRSMKKQALSEL